MTTKEQTLVLRLIAFVLAFFALLAWVTARADTGFLVDEYTKGSVRYCIYDVMGDEYIITVDYVDMCSPVVEV